MTTTDTQQPPGASVVAQHQEKVELIKLIGIYQARIDAMEELKEDLRRRLHALMDEGGDTKLVCEYGTATISSKRKFKVRDIDALIEMFPGKTIARAFKPTAAFVDGAAKAGLKILDVVHVEHDATFKVERPRTAEARERQREMIDRTKQEAEAAAEAVARQLRPLLSGPPK